ncbi:hypothetical protein ACQP25_44745 (plasmid) [Microtetraspora malaysiensis]|uniref:hypothetical protein n=1 Tax=Microtetraspora malaysiensis TaxID=161358 RepID=UPI003D8B9C67
MSMRPDPGNGIVDDLTGRIVPIQLPEPAPHLLRPRDAEVRRAVAEADTVATVREAAARVGTI